MTIEYAVVVNDPVSGDGDVINTVTGPPESNCDTGIETGCRTTTPIADLTVVKSATPNAVAPGGIVTYAIEIENTGGFVYSDATGPARVTDSLADDGVLDLATYVANSESATVGSAFFDGSTLSWTGPDAVWGPGATAIVTFQVRVNATPDVDGQTLTNTVVGPPESNCAAPDPTDPDCAVDVPVLERGLTIAKSSTPTTAFPGDDVSYTLTISNTGATAENGVTVTDDLADVLDDATSNGAPSASTGSAVIVGNVLTWTGDLAVGDTVTVTYDVTVDDPAAAGNGTLTNVVTGPPESNCPTSTPTPADECTTTTPLHELSVIKTATPSAPSAAEPGDTASYSLAITNTGAADYTAATPAVVTDDLTGLLDDAAVDPASLTVTPTGGSVALVGTTLTWTGPLAAGATVTVEFDAVVDDPILGDGSVVNTVVGPPESNCDVGSNDPGCTTTTPVRALDIDKVASPTGPVIPGDLITYTITVTNPGTVDYTAGSPAIVTDDLSDVLDDATISSQSASAGTLAFSGTDAVWTGPLSAGASATITIVLTVNDPVSGDGVLVNTVTGPPESNCDTGNETGCTTTTPVKELLITKVAQPTAVAPDGTVSYTVTVENTGGYAYTAVDPATFTDDLTPVLATATFVAGSASASAGTATYAAPNLSWSGPLAPGATATVTSDVRTVDAASVPAFDTPVVNLVVGPPESNCDTGSVDPGCTATFTVLEPGLTIAKTSTPTTADPGDVVTYTVLVTNTGETPEYGVSVVDDLTGVLDDAGWNVGSENAVASSASTTSLTFADPTLTWVGDIAIGGQVEITYSVTVDSRDALAAGAELDNVVTGPPESNCVVGNEPGCSTTTPIHQLQVAKSATPASGSTLRPGDRVTYEFAVSNIGSAAYSAGNLAVVTEDLSSVADDAALDPTSITVTPPIGSVDLVGDVGTWSGPLPAGQTVTITFDVVVAEPPTGDAQLLNRIVGPPESNCDTGSNDADCATTHPIEALRIVKTSDAGASVVPGQIVRYEVTATNIGQVAIDPAVVTDDLTAVLDDAIYRDDATATSDNADDGLVDDSTPILTWTGPLEADESVVITYSVRVADPNAAGYAGDGVLINAVTGPSESNCDLGNEPGCTTTVPIRALSIAKTSDAGADVVAGSTVTYDVVVTNTGQVDYPAGSTATFIDDLTGVLDDATYNDDATIAPAGQGIATYDSGASTLTWTGPLAVGASVTVTYSVDIDDPNDPAYTGDGIVENVVVGPPESNCGPQRVACRTEVPVRSLRITKSAAPTFVQPGDQVAYTITVENVGAVDYTIAAPASIVDDLSNVLDDATYDGNAVTTPGGVGTLAVDTGAETLTWAGPLAAGESLDITYSVTVDDPVNGDGQLDNVVTGPPESNCAPR